MRLRAAIVICVAVAALVLTGAKIPENGPKYLSPSDIAISKDGRILYVVCEGSDELLAVDSQTNAILHRVTVGRVPRSVALSSDGSLAYVTNSWSDTVSEVPTATFQVKRTLPAGFEPVGLAVDGAGTFAYTANRLSNDISVIDLKEGSDTRRLAAGHGSSYLALSPDGSRLYGTHIYPSLRGSFRAQPMSEITEVDAAHQVVASREKLPNVAGVFRIAISADGKLGIATQTRPKNLIPLAHVEHGWAFTNSVVLFGEDVGRAVQVPLDELERYFSLPYGVAIAPDKKTAYLSASSSDEVAILNVDAMLRWAKAPKAAEHANDLSASANYVTARIKTGSNPKGLALSPDGARLYVTNRLDDTISVIDTAAHKVISTMSLGGPQTITPHRRGERLFNTARYSFQGAFGCANCHLDATFDALSWDLEPDGFGIDIVDNRAIEDISETAPFKWNGGNPDLETECGPRTEKFFFRSQSFSKEELADLVTYIKAIPLRPNRYRLPNGDLTASQERGKAVFDRTQRKNGQPIPEELQCGVCHSGKYFTNRQLTDVGSGKSTDRSPLIDVPHLTNVVYSAPYLHDGSARTLEEIWTVFNPNDTHGVTNDLQKDELNDLIEYLKTL